MNVRNWQSWRLQAAALFGGFFRLARVLRNLESAYKSGKKVQLRRWDYLRRRALLACGWDCYARKVGSRYQLCFAPVSASELTDAATYQNLLGLAGVCMVDAD